MVLVAEYAMMLGIELIGAGSWLAQAVARTLLES
jgi:hypothetical protein